MINWKFIKYYFKIVFTILFLVLILNPLFAQNQCFILTYGDSLSSTNVLLPLFSEKFKNEFHLILKSDDNKNIDVNADSILSLLNKSIIDKYTFRRGITYFYNDIVLYKGGFYEYIFDSGASYEPDIDYEFWEPINHSVEDFYFLNSFLILNKDSALDIYLGDPFNNTGYNIAGEYSPNEIYFTEQIVYHEGKFYECWDDYPNVSPDSIFENKELKNPWFDITSDEYKAHLKGIDLVQEICNKREYLFSIRLEEFKNLLNKEGYQIKLNDFKISSLKNKDH